MAAAFKGHVEVVQALLAKGASPEVKDEDGNTALARATQWGKTEVIPLLRGAVGR